MTTRVDPRRPPNTAADNTLVTHVIREKHKEALLKLLMHL